MPCASHQTTSFTWAPAFLPARAAAAWYSARSGGDAPSNPAQIKRTAPMAGPPPPGGSASNVVILEPSPPSPIEFVSRIQGIGAQPPLRLLRRAEVLGSAIVEIQRRLRRTF